MKVFATMSETDLWDEDQPLPPEIQGLLQQLQSLHHAIYNNAAAISELTGRPPGVWLENINNNH